ncbi:MAG: TetR/AcrR family transcriptional regulator C-terminal domain-containing protein [Solirubrobacteraceae bacterium]|nr:TetR/AcrR family transcriptional regulator C-terminal domain-containing protein [Solirubrobacteraceae bacterium]
MSSGSIWARPEPGARKASLTRDQIARAAVELVDAEGVEALSMRRIAQSLGVGTMTLYHYVANKDELLALIDDAVMSEMVIPADEFPAGWRERLTAIAVSTRALHRRHPWLLAAVGEPRMQIGPGGLRHAEQTMSAFDGLGLPSEDVMDIATLVDEYTFGYVFHRQGDVGEDVFDDATADFFREHLEGGDYPALALLKREGESWEQAWARLSIATRDDARFERGLGRLLDGVELDLRRRGFLD